MTSAKKVVVIGAGMGGLSAALELAGQGFDVTVLEKQATPGGKMSQTRVGTTWIDAGPTVLTMRWVFDELFQRAGAFLEGRISLSPLEILARHAWDQAGHLDLYASEERTIEGIAQFAGRREADGYRRFAARSREIFELLDEPFMRRPCQSPFTLMRSVGLRKIPALARIAPFRSMHSTLKDYFRDPRLLQLFGRYATYCGSSPYRAPATLMLVAHAERCGVWSVSGGMYQLATAVEQLARERGAKFRYGAEVATILQSGGRVKGVELVDGESVPADHVLVNADAAAVASGCFGDSIRSAVAPKQPAQRSLSAVTWCFNASPSGFPLTRHNVFFSQDYSREFDDLLKSQTLPADPTVYLCAPDRLDTRVPPNSPERFFCLVNAPATGDSDSFDEMELARCKRQTMLALERCGLKLDCAENQTVQTTPRMFNQRYPATGGALYGPSSHGWRASFSRPSARTSIQGLYLAGGSTHPGPGMPMAALAGVIAAGTLIKDLGLPERPPPTAMPGGTSTVSAMTRKTP